jgi:hypothetical protein
VAMNIGGVDVFRPVLTQALRGRWVPFLIEGIVLVMLGVLAILIPVVTAVAGVIVKLAHPYQRLRGSDRHVDDAQYAGVLVVAGFGGARRRCGDHTSERPGP